MKKLLNTLYVMTPESYLKLEGENIVISKEGTVLFRVPFINLESIVCFNYLGVSPALMGKCVEDNVSLSFITPSGRYLASVEGQIKGNVSLRRKQYRIADSKGLSLKVAKNIIAAKLHNSSVTLSRTIRDHFDKVNVNALQNSIDILKSNIDKVIEANDMDSLRGIEGESARMYFAVFDHLIVVQKESFSFNVREKRPPLDNVNSMLSYMYTILALDTKSALCAVGLDPYVGFFHTDRSGRISLALDMMEELRSVLVDRFICTLINLNQVTHEDFLQKEGGGIIMTDEARKKILKEWQSKKNEEIMHPVIKEKIKIGLIPYVQAQLMAKFIRGDLDEYQPYFK